jgi:general secretion pathway protein K
MRPRSSKANCRSSNRETTSRSRRWDRGFALIVVLWLLLLLGLVARILLSEARSDRRAVAIEDRLVENRLLADAGINRAILSLVNRQDTERWRLDGTPRSVRLFDLDIEVRVESESGKIDINVASPDMLGALFRSQGLGSGDADELADRVVSWRTPLDLGLPDAAANPYREAERPYVPRHGPFVTVDELRLVIGMTDELQEKVAPMITIYSHTPDIDRQVATEPVLDVLAEMGDGLARTQRDARAQGQASGVERLPTMGEAVTIRSHVSEAEISVTRTAVVRLAGDRREPFWVLAWN